MVPIERVTVLWYISPIFDTEVRWLSQSQK
jgi:hypothetical protein